MSFPVPEIPSEWKNRAKDLEIIDTPMSQLEKLNSASAIGEEQFMCLRVLWSKPKEAKSFPASIKR
ncbi:hypothetical protein N7465_001435 [Penicillium sp. CMV-2018d]|nr:hypothetical protein N7465_001435 [Penicillium sp. CMV-2018d]